MAGSSGAALHSKAASAASAAGAAKGAESTGLNKGLPTWGVNPALCDRQKVSAIRLYLAREEETEEYIESLDYPAQRVLLSWEVLADARWTRDSFGPGTDWPCVIVNLEDVDERQSVWLAELPCPTIGLIIGKPGTEPKAEPEVKLRQASRVCDAAKACDLVFDRFDVRKDSRSLHRIVMNIEKAPFAAMILVQHLRLCEHLSLRDALTAESFAYATLQNGPEFSHWLHDNRAEHKSQERAQNPSPLCVKRRGSRLELSFDDPATLNVIGVAMRDALCEALDLALIDCEIEQTHLTGIGRCFSIGGDIEEFGIVCDSARGHWIRSLRLPAWRLARMQERLHVHVNGGAVGAGAEIAAFGKHVTAARSAWFQLPELRYGLIPGAGGTASLVGRIGRHRTTYMALSMERIKVQTALAWGLVDEILS